MEHGDKKEQNKIAHELAQLAIRNHQSHVSFSRGHDLLLQDQRAVCQLVVFMI